MFEFLRTHPVPPGALAIFDLDHTLLTGDSDYAWGQFLVENGLVDGADYARRNQRFYDDYRAGVLDIFAFLRFSLAPLARFERAQLDAWHRDFMERKIRPMIAPRAREALAAHRDAGYTVLVITATNRFVTEPIVADLGVEHLLATDPEVVDGRYSGQVTGIPCFREGKVERLRAWLAATGHALRGSRFYTDSHNDLPLLEAVDHPAAVDPDPTLRETARARGWPILSFR